LIGRYLGAEYAGRRGANPSVQVSSSLSQGGERRIQEDGKLSSVPLEKFFAICGPDMNLRVLSGTAFRVERETIFAGGGSAGSIILVTGEAFGACGGGDEV